MTWFRASGAMVATYWSVSVTVRMAHTEMTETGMRRDVRITSTQAMVRLVRGARGPFVSWAGDSVTLEVGLRAESLVAPDEIAPILPWHRALRS